MNKDKSEQQSKIINRDTYAEGIGDTFGIRETEIIVREIEILLHQQAAETRLATIEECAETFRKETEGVCHTACNKPLYLGSIYEKLKSLKEQTN